MSPKLVLPWLITQIPPGVRFYATDEQLIQVHLLPAVDGQPDPNSVIQVLDVYAEEPDNFQHAFQPLFPPNEYWYLVPVQRLRKHHPNRRIKRVPNLGGKWTYSSTKRITSGVTILGHKQSMYFATVTGLRTGWTIEEYRVATPTNTFQNLVLVHLQYKLDDDARIAEFNALNEWLQGRIKNSGDVVMYNDVGVPLVEAKANCNMSQILENPNPNELNKFLPFEFYEVSDVPLKIHLTFFECGGLALGVGLCHKLCDALSGLIFIRSWAASARGDAHEIITPSFDLAKMFPPCDMAGLNMATGITKENIVTKRFVFLKSSVESLRERFSRNKETRTTRVEALSVFIWSRFMSSTNQGNRTGRRIYTLIHPVNLRRQADPFIPDNIFGNIMRFSVTVPNMIINEDDGAKVSLVEQVREEIRKIDAVYVKKLQEDSRGHLEFLNKQASGFVKGEIVSFSFTSLYKFPVYEADFGWGKPLWVASARMSYKNLVAFIDTKDGDGIEAWINLDQNDMSSFETDAQLLHYVSSSPSVNISAS